MKNGKIKWQQLHRIRGLEGRDPRRSENPEEQCINKNGKYYLGILHFCENVHKHVIKPSTTNHLSGF